MTSRLPIALLTLSIAAAGLWAQSPSIALAYTVAGSASVNVAAGGSIPFGVVTVGASANITVSLTNTEQNAAVWTIAGTAITGGGYSTGTPSRLRLAPGETATLALRFAPTQAGSAIGALTLQLDNGSGTLRTITLTLSATAAASPFALSYILAQGGNELSLDASATITFPGTAVSQSVTAIVIVTSKATVAAEFQSASISGGGFQISGLPILPYTVQPGGQLRFNVTLTPSSLGSISGALTLGLAGSTRMIALQGLGTGSSLTYSYWLGTTQTTALAGGTLPFPDTPLGGTASLVLQVSNAGNATGQVTAVTVSTVNFRTADLPALPRAIPAGESFRFTIVFAPQEVGNVSARLAIDDVAFNLSGTATGGKLAYSYGDDSTTTTVVPNGIIVFPNAAVGARSSVTMQLANQGNRPLDIRSIAVSGTGFTSGAPGGASTVAPGDTIVFPITFTPQVLGTIGGTLVVDDKSFVLRATGTAPPKLPAISWSGLAGAFSALQQPAAGVSLNDIYPLDLKGTLALSFSSASFADDPAIQFASGGRTISFRIPANSRDAIFTDGASAARFQTGSVGGTITLEAAFSVAAVDITPTPAPATTIVIPAGAPVLRGAQVSSRSGNTIVVLISGYCTARAVKSLSFDFAAAAGYSLQSTSVVVDVESAFGTWYQSSGSTPYGSQFSVAANITAGDINALQTVVVGAANGLGSSSPVTLQLKQ